MSFTRKNQPVLTVNSTLNVRPSKVLRSIFLLGLAMVGVSGVAQPVRAEVLISQNAYAGDAYLVLTFTKEITPHLKKIKANLLRIGIVYKGAGSDFVVVEVPPKLARSEGINKLSKFSNLKSIESDKQVYPLDNVHVGAAPTTESAAAQKCQLGQHCKNGANPQWAKLTLGADLANQELEKFLNKSDSANLNAARVGVVDSGFDFATHEKSMKTLSFQTARGHDSAGDDKEDFDGHGTAVASMIGAKDIGITDQVHLKVFRLTEVFAGGSTSDALLAASIEKACAESDVVNVSWGSLSDDTDGINPESERWYKKVVESGCIVVKAAGNDGMRNARRYEPKLTDPVIVSAATDKFESLAQFSTLGQIKTPGEQTYTLLSKQHGYGNETMANVCGGNAIPVGPVNGTSFAAPATTAVTAMIVGALRAKGLIQKPVTGQPRLSKNDVALVKNILFASSTLKSSGVVDALGAMKMVELLGRSRNLQKFSSEQGVEELKALYRDQKTTMCILTPFPMNCVEKGNCAERLECVNQARKYYHLCQPLGGAQLVKLNAYYQNLDEDELAASILLPLSENAGSQALASQEMDRRWRGNLDPGNVTHLKSGAKGLETLVSLSRSPLRSSMKAQQLQQCLSAGDLETALGIEEELATNPMNSGAEFNFTRLMAVFLALEPAEQKAFLSNLKPRENSSNRAYAGTLYILDKNRESLSPELRTMLDRRIEEFLGNWIDDKITVFNYASIAHTPLFDQLFANRPMLKNRLLNKLEIGKNLKLNESAIYALKSKKFLSDEKSKEAALDLVRALGTEKASAGQDSKILGLLMSGRPRHFGADEIQLIKNKCAETAVILPTGLVPFSQKYLDLSPFGGEAKNPTLWQDIGRGQIHQQLRLLEEPKVKTTSTLTYANHLTNFCRVNDDLDSSIVKPKEMAKVLIQDDPTFYQVLDLSVALALKGGEKQEDALALLQGLTDRSCHTMISRNAEIYKVVMEKLKPLLEMAKQKPSKIPEDLARELFKYFKIVEDTSLTPGFEEKAKELQARKVSDQHFLVNYADALSPPSEREWSKTYPKELSAGSLGESWNNVCVSNGDGSHPYIMRINEAFSVVEASLERQVYANVTDEKMEAIFFDSTVGNALSPYQTLSALKEDSPQKNTLIRFIKIFQALPEAQQLRLVDKFSKLPDGSARLRAGSLVYVLQKWGGHASADMKAKLDAVQESLARQWIAGKMPPQTVYGLSSRRDLVGHWMEVLKSKNVNLKELASSSKNSTSNEGWFYYALTSSQLTAPEKQQLLRSLMSDPAQRLGDPHGVQMTLGAYEDLDLKSADSDYKLLKDFIVRNPLIEDSHSIGNFSNSLISNNPAVISVREKALGSDKKFIEKLLNSWAQEVTKSIRDTSPERKVSVASGAYRLYYEWMDNAALSESDRQELFNSTLPALTATVEECIRTINASGEFAQKQNAKDFLRQLLKSRKTFDSNGKGLVLIDRVQRTVNLRD